MRSQKEEAQLIAIWKKALEKHPEHLELKFTHASNAMSIRLKLYQIMKPFREEKEFDPEMQDASEKLMIRVEKRENASFVVFMPKTLTTELNAALEALGIDVESQTDSKTASDLEAEASLQRLLELRDKPTTPFYER